MSKRVYRNAAAVIRAAARKIGGRAITYDGAPALHIAERGTDGQIVNTYLTPERAADAAGLVYRPNEEQGTC